MKNLIILSFLVSSFSFAKIQKISSLDLSSSDREWRLLDKLGKNSELIGIGESGHGSSTYLLARLRMAAHLIKKHNYRLILLEDELITTNNVDFYLNECRSSVPGEKKLDHVLTYLYKTYQNKETKKLLQWMCLFNNKNANDPIRFKGIDIWDSPWDFRDEILKAQEYITELKDKEKFNKYFNLAKNSCFAWGANSWEEALEFDEYQYYLENRRFDSVKSRKCLATMIHLEKVLRKYSKDDVVFSSFMAMKSAEAYEKTIDIRDINFSQAMSIRDEAQAYSVIQFYKRYGKKKAIFFAHNLHISKKQSVVDVMNPGNRYSWNNVKSAGEFLVGHFGAKYKAIALTGYEVSSSRDGDYVISDKERSLERILSQRYEMALFSTKSKFLRKYEKWWMHTENEQMYLLPKEQYDLVFFTKTSASAEPIAI